MLPRFSIVACTTDGSILEAATTQLNFAHLLDGNQRQQG
jgi:hypothetical protein